MNNFILSVLALVFTTASVQAEIAPARYAEILKTRDQIKETGFALFRDLGCYLSHDNISVAWNTACDSLFPMVMDAVEIPEFEGVVAAAGRLNDIGTPACAERAAEVMTTSERKDACVATAQLLKALDEAVLNEFIRDYRR